MSSIICCRGAVSWSYGSPLTIETIHVSPPKEGEVRIQVKASGICGSDDHAINGKMDGYFPGHPIICGHEAAGIVESVGAGVTSVVKGDHVIPVWMPECGSCELCSNEFTNFCVQALHAPKINCMLDGTTRLIVNGKEAYKFLSIGSFAEYVVVPEICVTKIPKEVIKLITIKI